MMKIPTCCGDRMCLDLNTDEAFCGTCGLRISGQEVVKLELERQRKREDEIIARLWERNATSTPRPKADPIYEARHRIESCTRCGKTATLYVQDGGHPPWICGECEIRMTCCGKIMGNSMMNGFVCNTCERFQHRNGNRTPDAWWKQQIGLCERGGPFVSDPLDVVIDGCTLHELVSSDETERREQWRIGMPRSVDHFPRSCWTSAQREAVSAYWSAQLRAKVAMSTDQDAERDRLQVVMEHDEL